MHCHENGALCALDAHCAASIQSWHYHELDISFCLASHFSWKFILVREGFEYIKGYSFFVSIIFCKQCSWMDRKIQVVKDVKRQNTKSAKAPWREYRELLQRITSDWKIFVEICNYSCEYKYLSEMLMLCWGNVTLLLGFHGEMFDSSHLSSGLISFPLCVHSWRRLHFCATGLRRESRGQFPGVRTPRPPGLHSS